MPATGSDMVAIRRIQPETEQCPPSLIRPNIPLITTIIAPRRNAARCCTGRRFSQHLELAGNVRGRPQGGRTPSDGADQAGNGEKGLAPAAQHHAQHHGAGNRGKQRRAGAAFDRLHRIVERFAGSSACPLNQFNRLFRFSGHLVGRLTAERTSPSTGLGLFTAAAATITGFRAGADFPPRKAMMAKRNQRHCDSHRTNGAERDKRAVGYVRLLVRRIAQRSSESIGSQGHDAARRRLSLGELVPPAVS